MNGTEALPGITAAATVSKKSANQDAFALIGNGENWPSGVVVADGLGSHFGAEIAAPTAAATIARALRGPGGAVPRRVRAALGHGVDAVHDAWLEARASAPQETTGASAFGTTALICVEEPEDITMAYLGNGAMIHARGNFNTFPPSQLLPWSALNMLNPHSVPRDGKNLLHRHIAGESTVTAVTPTVVRLSKDLDAFGDIIIVTTDGIASFDQTPMGHDDEGRVWVSGEPSLGLLYEYLSAFFDGPASAARLRQYLERYLVRLDELGLVQDDCTVAVLVTQRTIEYQRHRQAAHEPSPLADAALVAGVASEVV